MSKLPLEKMVRKLEIESNTDFICGLAIIRSYLGLYRERFISECNLHTLIDGEHFTIKSLKENKMELKMHGVGKYTVFPECVVDELGRIVEGSK